MRAREALNRALAEVELCYPCMKLTELRGLHTLPLERTELILCKQLGYTGSSTTYKVISLHERNNEIERLFKKKHTCGLLGY